MSYDGNIWWTYEDAYDDINRNNHAMISIAISSMMATEDIRTKNGRRGGHMARTYGKPW